ncbi:MAG: acyl-CoA dehydrogenase family protein [Candidatus Binatia bacterium]|nr:acyl-CoA dehydrogenase family protein [Candidatus Binatia bacterium]
MNLKYSKDYQRFREEVRQFIKDHWTEEDVAANPQLSEMAQGLGSSPRTDERATAFRRAAAERGYMYRHVPRAYGGGEQAPDPLKATILVEELKAAKAPVELMSQGPAMLVPTLLAHGTEEQKKQYVESTLLGHVRWCQGYSEPGAGSDLASLRTSGVLEGDHWVVNGQKIWTSNAREADMMFALIRTEPDEPKHDGISYLLIDMKTQGIDVRPLRQMDGDAHFNEVFLDNVRVPRDSVVGERGQGWYVSRSTLKAERALIGNASMARRTFDGAVALAQMTQVRGRPAIEDPVIRDRLTDLESRVLAAEYNGFRLLTESAKGHDGGLAGLVTKLHTSTLAHDVSKLAMNISSDAAMLAPGEEHAPFAGMLVQSYIMYYALAIGGGAPNIQRNVIGERGLGLPRDPRR